MRRENGALTERRVLRERIQRGLAGRMNLVDQVDGVLEVLDHHYRVIDRGPSLEMQIDRARQLLVHQGTDGEEAVFGVTPSGHIVLYLNGRKSVLPAYDEWAEL